jgi:dTDP-4-amino-4,6-dideoxygalactose transaminase
LTTARFPFDAAPSPGGRSAAEGLAAAAIPVLRPLLPDADRLLPYLRRIDANRTYSNFGPLACEFEDRIAALLAQGPGTVVSASSGLAALVGAILATSGRATAARPLALIPAYTFVASAAAVELCGYVPHLVDIDADTWLMDAQALRTHPLLDRVGLVMPVAALGRPVPLAPWSAFTRDTGIPVVVDAAASVESLQQQPDRYLGEVPVALSFHATKSLCTGEGGAVVSTDTALVARALRALNFGFHTSRDCQSPSTNGKLSEYHAAIGLAELDGWPAKQDAFRRVSRRFHAAFAARGWPGRLHPPAELGTNRMLWLADDAGQAARACAAMELAQVGYRLWYGLGLHHQTYYADAARDPLPATDDLAPRLVGLPFAQDLADADIDRVADVVTSALAAGG